MGPFVLINTNFIYIFCSIQSNPQSNEEESDNEEDLIEPFAESVAHFEDSDSDVEDTVQNTILPQRASDAMLEHDDIDHFVTTSLDPDLSNFGEDNDGHMTQEIDGQLFAFEATNSGEYVQNVREDNTAKGVCKDITISGHTILNQCGSLLTRQKHQIKGSRKQSFFLQKICSTSTGTSIPLMYPEAMLFPSIFWKAADDNTSILGAIPAPLLTDAISRFGFAYRCM